MKLAELIPVIAHFFGQLANSRWDRKFRKRIGTFFQEFLAWTPLDRERGGGAEEKPKRSWRKVEEKLLKQQIVYWRMRRSHLQSTGCSYDPNRNNVFIVRKNISDLGSVWDSWSNISNFLRPNSIWLQILSQIEVLINLEEASYSNQLI